MRFLLLVVFVLLFAGCYPRPHLATLHDPSQLVVSGQASIEVVPDQLEMSLEVVTVAATAEEALADNSAAIEQLQQVLVSEGLTRSDYRTGQFSLQPQWSRPPRPTPAHWAAEIVGYRVNNNVQIATPRIELAGRLLALAQQAGVNRAGNLRFSLADPEAANLQAIAAATDRARQRAETLAAAAGVHLGRLLEARVDDGGPVAPPMRMMAGMASAKAVNTVPLSAGEVEVRAAVVLRYAVQDRGPVCHEVQ